jgi:hypothetical protein
VLYVSTYVQKYVCKEFVESETLVHGCQMVYFQTKIPIWVNFGGP